MRRLTNCRGRPRSRCGAKVRQSVQQRQWVAEQGHLSCRSRCKQTPGCWLAGAKPPLRYASLRSKMIPDEVATSGAFRHPNGPNWLWQSSRRSIVPSEAFFQCGLTVTAAAQIACYGAARLSLHPELRRENDLPARRNYRQLIVRHLCCEECCELVRPRSCENRSRRGPAKYGRFRLPLAQFMGPFHAKSWIIPARTSQGRSSSAPANGDSITYSVAARQFAMALPLEWRAMLGPASAQSPPSANGLTGRPRRIS